MNIKLKCGKDNHSILLENMDEKEFDAIRITLQTIFSYSDCIKNKEKLKEELSIKNVMLSYKGE